MRTDKKPGAVQALTQSRRISMQPEPAAASCGHRYKGHPLVSGGLNVRWIMHMVASRSISMGRLKRQRRSFARFAPETSTRPAKIKLHDMLPTKG